MKIEHENFVTNGIGVTEAVLEDEGNIDYLQENEQDDREEEAYVNGYYSNDFGWGYRYGIC